MNFYPKRNDELKSANSVDKIILNIKENTLITSFISIQKTDKALVGYTDTNFFKVASSEIPLGVFCVFTGKMEEKENEVIIKLSSEFNTTLKKVTYIWWLLLFGVLCMGFFGLKFENFLRHFFSVLVFIFITYKIIQFLFKKSYIRGIQRLNIIINK